MEKQHEKISTEIEMLSMIAEKYNFNIQLWDVKSKFDVETQQWLSFGAAAAAATYEWNWMHESGKCMQRSTTIEWSKHDSPNLNE